MTLTETNTLTETEARRITDQIMGLVGSAWDLIAVAYQRRAWAALGYSSWDDYCGNEFGTTRLRLPREERQEVVASLRDSGLSTRAIASATGQSKSQVANDLNALSRNGQRPQPERVQTTAGHSYPAERPKPDNEPLFAPGEQEAILGQLHDEYGDEIPTEALDEAVNGNVASKDPTPGKPPWQPTKPDLGEGISHPARYSPELIAAFRDLLHEYSFPGARILDPFAGTGKIHELHPDYDTVGIELEAEWANIHPRTQIGNALDLPFDPDTFDAIVTSPTYGNRLADSHNASDPERRRSYTHDLGRDLSAENSGAMHWRNGTQGSIRYRTFHEKAWDEAVLVLKPGGIFVLNFKDHWRDGALMPVGNWHAWCLGRLGLDYIDSFSISTGSLRQGANGELRSVELVLVYGKPS